MEDFIIPISKTNYILDIDRLDIGREISITGIIIRAKKFADGNWALKIKDITGEALILIKDEAEPLAKAWNLLNVSTKVRIHGYIGLNSKNRKVIQGVYNFNILGRLDEKLSELDEDRREQASRVLMSRISRSVSNFLTRENFEELETRLISNHWKYDSLEPLQVVYPGFGPPAFLITSPATQVVEFLTTTLLLRGFTVSKSFCTSYRFPNGSSETTVIVAKAMDLEIEQHLKLFKLLASSIFNEFSTEPVEIMQYKGKWRESIEYDVGSEQLTDKKISLIDYQASIPVVGEQWEAKLTNIIQLQDINGNLLAEGSREKLSNRTTISSLVIYPSQFLDRIEKSPKRQLQNLMKLFHGRFQISK